MSVFCGFVGYVWQSIPLLNSILKMGLDRTPSSHVAALVDAAKRSFNVQPMESRSENGRYGLHQKLPHCRCCMNGRFRRIHVALGTKGMLAFLAIARRIAANMLAMRNGTLKLSVLSVCLRTEAAIQLM